MMDMQGIEPWTSRMLSGCDNTTPHALVHFLVNLCTLHITHTVGPEPTTTSLRALRSAH